MIPPNRATHWRITHEPAYQTGQRGCYLCSRISINREQPNESQNIHTVEHDTSATKCEGTGYRRMKCEAHDTRDQIGMINWKDWSRQEVGETEEKLMRIKDGPIWENM